MSSVQQIQNLKEYGHILSRLSAGEVMVMSFVDPLAAPCWDFTNAFQEASENPHYAQRGVGFYSVDCSLESLDPIREQLVIVQVPMLVFVRAGQRPMKVTPQTSTREQILGVIAQYCS